MHIALRVLAIAALIAVAGPALAAAPSRAFVSGRGVDKAGCGDTAAPCRTLQYVHDSIIAPGGEIAILDGAEYGPVKISKALSIVNEGAGVASLTQTATGQNAVSINAGANDNIYLRGLELEGVGIATTGVYYASGASVQIANCVMRHFKNVGVYAFPAAAAKMTISDTLVAESGGGVLLAPRRTLTATITGSRAFNVNNGFEATGRYAPAGTSIFVEIENSAVSGSAIGFLVSTGANTARPIMALNGVTATGNGFGVVANGGNIRLANSALTANGYGVSVSNGLVYTLKNNQITDNGQKVLGALTPYTAD